MENIYYSPDRNLINYTVFFLATLISVLSAQQPPPGWSEPLLISDGTSGIARQPHISVSGDHIAIVWSDFSTQVLPHEVYLKEFVNGQWTAPVNFSQSDTIPSSLPQVYLEDNGDMHLFWGERIGPQSPRPTQPPTHLLYSYKDTTFSTIPDTVYSYVDSIAGYSNLDVEYSADGEKLFAIWEPPPQPTLNTGPLFAKKVNGIWTTPTKVDTGSRGTIAVDSGGRIHATFTYVVFDTSLGGDINSLFYTYSDDEGETWIEGIAVDTSGPNRPVFDPEIIVDSQGKIHLVYSRSIDGDLFPDFLFHRWSLDGSQWSPLDSFPDNFPGRHYPAIIHLDSLDRLDAIWYHDSDVGTDGLMHSVFENNSWSEPEFLFQTRYSFHYVIDENGILHLVWSGEWNGVQGVYYSQKDLITATDPVKPVAVKGFKLNQNYPNPFNPSTSITFQLPHQASVELKVFDIQGRLVRTLVNKTLPGGQHRVSWNGRNDRGMQVSSGVYLYRLSAVGASKGESFTQTRKMVLIR